MTETKRIQDICRYIETHSDDNLTLDDLAAKAGMSKFHFVRRFKSIVGVSPKQYALNVRLGQLKDKLKSGQGVDAAIYDAGYGSSSRVYENAARQLGMTPAQYRRAGEGVSISYATLDTPAGLMMIGATDRGVCFAQLGDSEDELLGRLRSEYRNAEIEPMREPRHPEFARWVDAIERYISGRQPSPQLPLDVRATAFQMRVWKYLQSIPYGDVQSYGEVAAGIGEPRAARAVASACAANPAAIVIPCHRVIRQTGDLGGYRWGMERKRALLDHERALRMTRGKSRRM
ncbi:MAG TPA: methylated-DNA--[protein]-cysteine S-methyltransferase [Candidatus Babeliales bacterium]|nr:methylated-DNA--[protein]-cysteine S-methyltransferase [Candidatus Babeliales bacterium]